MPFKHRDPWHNQLREYLREIGPTVDPGTVYIYEWRLNAVGKVMGDPDPRKVDLLTMRALESRLPGVETNRAILANAAKTFFMWCGNRDAMRWRISVKQRPKVGGVFLSELQVRACRQVARSLGPFHELVFSLGVDNGLRCIDMRRLTMLNYDELVRLKSTEILGKGRNGGKVGHLELSRMTEEPLGRYLEIRRGIAKTYGRDWEELIIWERAAPPMEAYPITYSKIKELCADIAEGSGIEQDPHDWRRTYGNRLHKAGVPIETIAKLMRHETINQAFRAYIGIDADEMRAAQDKLCPF